MYHIVLKITKQKLSTCDYIDLTAVLSSFVIN